ncbi:trypsin-like peptidase domain-containing protein [Streptomyces sp. SL13]|uniref:Trypsin-like peptidase domain-containing protein n=1 Tax=Streptantibioticus silvisoli TaxID=2705255 RepID=A0AA90JZD0_9ACTN|nr:trypsin-like peptidase domain-containing protein [Streptantibioticus silvisoli]MDI5971951.1 trypsin-like peptidase domain-containing protein [Streptantibioticus silvisoli]
MRRSGRLTGLALACVTAVVLSCAAPASPARPVASRARRAARSRTEGPPTGSTRPRPAPAPPADPGAADRAGGANPVGDVWPADGQGPADAGGPAATARWLPPAPRFPAQFRVGAVFGTTGRAHHYCTGSVIDSPRRDLVITAAHCVHDGTGGGYRGDLAFSPGLRAGGDEPAGRWRVRTALAAPSWVAAADPSADVAFLVVEPLDGERIEDAVGGNPIAFDHPQGGPVQLIGYPSDQDAPVICDGAARRSGLTQLRVYCPGFTGGTSGSPWLSGVEGGSRTTGSGSVIGVIGGYQEGGSTSDVSYSSYFDARVRALYEQAVRES